MRHRLLFSKAPACTSLLSQWDAALHPNTVAAAGFPNLYLMIVAVSTYYRKSAGLDLAGEVARLALPHMIMPQPGSPENFMMMLGGVLPPNFSDIVAPRSGAPGERQPLCGAARIAPRRAFRGCSSRWDATTWRG